MIFGTWADFLVSSIRTTEHLPQPRQMCNRPYIAIIQFYCMQCASKIAHDQLNFRLHQFGWMKNGNRCVLDAMMKIKIWKKKKENLRSLTIGWTSCVLDHVHRPIHVSIVSLRLLVDLRPNHTATNHLTATKLHFRELQANKINNWKNCGVVHSLIGSCHFCCL